MATCCSFVALWSRACGLCAALQQSAQAQARQLVHSRAFVSHVQWPSSAVLVRLARSCQLPDLRPIWCILSSWLRLAAACDCRVGAVRQLLEGRRCSACISMCGFILVGLGLKEPIPWVFMQTTPCPSWVKRCTRLALH